MKQHVLFVDDDTNVLEAYRRGLRDRRDQWELTLIPCSLLAWDTLQKRSFDTAVFDVRMPGLNGIDLLTRVQQSLTLRDMPVIIVTGEADRSLKRTALNLGAADLLNKPIDREDLLARLNSTLRLKAAQDALRVQNQLLEHRVRERTAQLVASRLDIIWRLAKAAEYRDEETGNHVIRVGCYSRAIARVMGLDAEFVDNMLIVAPLHDIGKIGVPDSVLHKPGRLDHREWRVMRKHCDMGAEILSDECRFKHVARRFGADSQTLAHVLPADDPVLALATSIARGHHEHWNGAGYPHGLQGEEIPLEARIVAIADVYDALRSERPYKQAFSVDRALSILAEENGTHFDPAVYEAFLLAFDEINALESEFNDAAAPLLSSQVHDEDECLVC
ncbi:MAG: response regulator [Planctomycetales bacterium]|nr:response regulator [Planctomycetales bacterium]